MNDDVLNIVVPITFSVTIDPLEVAGKGQIYSNVYSIVNNGDSDVNLTFTDIQITFADDINFAALAQPYDEQTESELKSIYMLLDFGRIDVPPAVITDPGTKGAITIPLSSTLGNTPENSLVQFNFSGSVNYAPAIPWADGDIKISMAYTLVTVPPPVEEVIPQTTGDAIEASASEEAATNTEETAPITEESTLITEETAPTAEESTPITEETAPTAEESTPITEETAPAEDEITPTEDTADTPVTEPPAEPSESADPTESPPQSDTTEADSCKFVGFIRCIPGNAREPERHVN